MTRRQRANRPPDTSAIENCAPIAASPAIRSTESARSNLARHLANARAKQRVEILRPALPHRAKASDTSACAQFPRPARSAIRNPACFTRRASATSSSIVPAIAACPPACSYASRQIKMNWPFAAASGSDGSFTRRKTKIPRQAAIDERNQRALPELRHLLLGRIRNQRSVIRCASASARCAASGRWHVSASVKSIQSHRRPLRANPQRMVLSHPAGTQFARSQNLQPRNIGGQLAPKSPACDRSIDRQRRSSRRSPAARQGSDRRFDVAFFVACGNDG